MAYGQFLITDVEAESETLFRKDCILTWEIGMRYPLQYCCISKFSKYIDHIISMVLIFSSHLILRMTIICLSVNLPPEICAPPSLASQKPFPFLRKVQFFTFSILTYGFSKTVIFLWDWTEWNV